MNDVEFDRVLAAARERGEVDGAGGYYPLNPDIEWSLWDLYNPFYVDDVAADCSDDERDDVLYAYEDGWYSAATAAEYSED